MLQKERFCHVQTGKNEDSNREIWKSEIYFVELPSNNLSINPKMRIVMSKKANSFDETYELDNVYNCDSDELYSGLAGGESSAWCN